MVRPMRQQARISRPVPWGVRGKRGKPQTRQAGIFYILLRRARKSESILVLENSVIYIGGMAPQSACRRFKAHICWSYPENRHFPGTMARTPDFPETFSLATFFPNRPNSPKREKW